MSGDGVTLERKMPNDRRIIRAGEHVKIAEVRGTFRVRAFRGDDVECFGPVDTKKAPAVRTFAVDRIGRRVRVATRED